jgi:hypothetical protein
MLYTCAFGSPLPMDLGLGVGYRRQAFCSIPWWFPLGAELFREILLLHRALPRGPEEGGPRRVPRGPTSVRASRLSGRKLLSLSVGSQARRVATRCGCLQRR